MSRARSPSKSGGLFSKPVGPRPKETYARLAMRPLHVLVFLLPLMVLYEVGSIRYLSDPSNGVMETIGARSILGGFFDLFGSASLHLPPVLLAVVLLVWHALERDSWRVRPHVLLGMLLESCVWMLPVLVFSHLMGSKMAGMMTNDPLAQHTWQAKLTLSVGAGIYEELLFRLILVTVVHLVLVDLMKLSQGVGFVVAALVSALTFALYHDVARHDTIKFLFLAGAGAYFAVLYIMRGFGIAVATHALYDVVVLIGVSQVQQQG